MRAAWAGDSNIKGYLRASSTGGQVHWERVLVYNMDNLGVLRRAVVCV